MHQILLTESFSFLALYKEPLAVGARVPHARPPLNAGRAGPGVGAAVGVGRRGGAGLKAKAAWKQR